MCTPSELCNFFGNALILRPFLQLADVLLIKSLVIVELVHNVLVSGIPNHKPDDVLQSRPLFGQGEKVIRFVVIGDTKIPHGTTPFETAKNSPTSQHADIVHAGTSPHPFQHVSHVGINEGIRSHPTCPRSDIDFVRQIGPIRLFDGWNGVRAFLIQPLRLTGNRFALTAGQDAFEEPCNLTSKQNIKVLWIIRAIDFRETPRRFHRPNGKQYTNTDDRCRFEYLWQEWDKTGKHSGRPCCGSHPEKGILHLEKRLRLKPN